MSSDWQRPASSESSILEAFLSENPQVEGIIIQSINYSNVNITVCCLTIERVRRIANGLGYFEQIGSRNRAQSLGGGMNWENIKGEMDWYFPDWTTLRVDAGEPRMATVICDVWEQHWRDEVLKTAFDPRVVLRNLESTGAEMGLNFLVGSEVEWHVLETAHNAAPYSFPGSSSQLIFSHAGFRSPYRTTVLDIVRALDNAKIPIWTYLSDSAPHGWEISLGPLSPLAAMDDLVYTSETIRDVTNKNGLHATMHPEAFENKGFGSVGRHFHLSINGPTAERDAPHFRAGILHYLPAVCAFLLGGYDSYRKERRSQYGHGFACWSTQKNCGIRQVTPTRWEIRISDALTNPYLQISALLAAGLQGIRRQLPPTIKAIPSDVRSADEMGRLVMADGGAKLPSNVFEAHDLLERDLKDKDGFSALMGKEMVECYLAFRKKEANVLSGMDPEERRKAIVVDV